MTETLPYRQGGAVIARRPDGRYLLVRKPRLHHAWQWPQGGVEVGEDARAAALREFTEEIGTDKLTIIGDERALFRYDFPPGAEFPAYVHERLERYRGQEVHIFLADYLGTDDDIHLEPTELVEYRWVTPEELPALIENPEYLQLSLTIINYV